MDIYKLFRTERDRAMHLLDEMCMDCLLDDEMFKKRDLVIAEFDNILDHLQVLSDELAKTKKEVKENEEIIKQMCKK